MAPAQKQAYPEGHHHHQEEAAHNPRSDGRDLGPGTGCRHRGRSDLWADFMTFARPIFPACTDTLTLFKTEKVDYCAASEGGGKAKDAGQRF